MDEETWMILLHVKTGIADYLLNVIQENNELVPHLLDSVFSTYVQSGIQNAELVESFFVKWSTQEKPLTYLYDLTKAFTSRVIEVMHNFKYDHNKPKEEVKSVVILKERKKIDFSEVLVSMPDEHLVYMWFRLFTIFGRKKLKKECEVQKMQTECLIKLMQFIYDVVKRVTRVNYPEVPSIDLIHTVHHIRPRFAVTENLKGAIANYKKRSLQPINLYFITEYFEANLFDESIPHLIEFLNKFHGPYKIPKLALYYNKVKEYYNKLNIIGDISLIKEVVNSNLFICSGRLYGINVLINPFLNLLGYFFNNMPVLTVSIEDLVKILVHISTLTHAYKSDYQKLLPGASFISNWTMSSVYLRQIINNLNTFGEFSAGFYWLIAISVMQNYSSAEKMNYLTEFIHRMYNGFRFLNDANLIEGRSREIFCILDIAEMIVNSFVDGKQLMPDPTSIILYLLDIINKSATNDRTLIKRLKSEHILIHEKIICKTLKLCMIIGNISTTFSYISIINQLKEIAFKYTKPPTDEKQLKLSYKMIKRSVLATLESLKINNKRSYGLVKDIENSSIINGALKNAVNYVVNQKVITVVDMGYLLIVIRDVMGIFCYRGESITKVKKYEECVKFKQNGNEELLVNDKPPDLLESDSSRFNFKDMNCPLKDTVSLIEMEEEFLRKQNKSISNSREHKTVIRKKGLNPVTSRMLLCHLRAIDRNCISLLENDDKVNTCIHNLDVISLKRRVEIVLLYTTEHNNMHSRYVNDKAFMIFLNTLGIRLTKEHIKTERFNYLKRSIEDVGIIYASDYFTELLFLLYPLSISGNSRPGVEGTQMNIIWNTDPILDENKVITSIRTTSSTNAIAIIITPIKNTLFLINILGIIKNKSFYCNLFIDCSKRNKSTFV